MARSKKTAPAPAKITRKTNLAELALNYPLLAQILTQEFDLHCVGCMAAGFESLEEGAKAHGYTDEDVDEIVDYLNKILNSES